MKSIHCYATFKGASFISCRLAAQYMAQGIHDVIGIMRIPRKALASGLITCGVPTSFEVIKGSPTAMASSIPMGEFVSREAMAHTFAVHSSCPTIVEDKVPRKCTHCCRPWVLMEVLISSPYAASMIELVRPNCTGCPCRSNARHASINLRVLLRD